MRRPADAEKVQRLIAALAQRARGPGRVYLTGGASAVLFGWRASTIDVDLKLDPEPPGVFEAIARLKEELDLNVELASPDQFIPSLPGWRERSRAIDARGPVEFFHYDFRAQALAKIERGHGRDLEDVAAMVRRGLVTADELSSAFAEIEPELIRYPALDPESFREKLASLLRSLAGGGS
jgi:hypothetical protein